MIEMLKWMDLRNYICLLPYAFNQTIDRQHVEKYEAT
jgi:hypothetical protein